MIDRLTGLLAEKSAMHILLDANGVGYGVDVPLSTFLALPAAGDRVSLFTHLSIKEDAHSLYGFATADERAAFRLLLTVTGIGARTALGVLSGMSVDELGVAIAAGDSALIVKIPGVGPKTAERVVLDLKTKFAKVMPSAVPNNAELFVKGPRDEVAKALAALGYKDKEIDRALTGLTSDMSVADGIRLGLKMLTNG